MFNEVRMVPKPRHKRRVPKRKDRGKISQSAYNEVWKRDNGRCVLCGKEDNLELHHIVFRSSGGSGEPDNLALACGPATQSGTCHWRAHNSRAGRIAFVDYRNNVLLPYYKGGAS